MPDRSGAGQAVAGQPTSSQAFDEPRCPGPVHAGQGSQHDRVGVTGEPCNDVVDGALLENEDELDAEARGQLPGAVRQLGHGLADGLLHQQRQLPEADDLPKRQQIVCEPDFGGEIAEVGDAAGPAGPGQVRQVRSQSHGSKRRLGMFRHPCGYGAGDEAERQHDIDMGVALQCAHGILGPFDRPVALQDHGVIEVDVEFSGGQLGDLVREQADGFLKEGSVPVDHDADVHLLRSGCGMAGEPGEQGHDTDHEAHPVPSMRQESRHHALLRNTGAIGSRSDPFCGATKIADPGTVHGGR